jgi:hypothetical protein
LLICSSVACVVGLMYSQLRQEEIYIGLASNKNDAIPAAAIVEADPRALLSYRQSFGFFDDITDDEWRMLQGKVGEVYPNTNGNPYGRHESPTSFYQNHYEPDFACRHERRLGQLGDGGKWVCDPHRLGPNRGRSGRSFRAANMSLETTEHVPPPPPCLVYSIGSNGEPSFENGIRDFIGPHCEIHVFDMDNFTDKVSPTGATFHQWGLTSNGGKKRLGQHVYKTLNQTLHELGHIGRPIDIFKIDCEGCERDIFQDFFLPGIDLRQVLIELHAAGGLLPKIPNFFRAMYRNGYVIFHKEPNIQYSNGGNAIEYSFLKLHPEFFRDIPQLYKEITSVSSNHTNGE